MPGCIPQPAGPSTVSAALRSALQQDVHPSDVQQLRPATRLGYHGEVRPAWLTFAVACALCAGLSAPALGGGWVYDDRYLATADWADDWGDLWAVVSQHSGDYLAPDKPDEARVGGVTYRPLSMFTLVGVHVATSGSALAHHLLSLLLHLACAAALMAAVARRMDVPALPWAAMVGVWMVLHPGIAEAHLWINGRSDVLAGLCLALLALLLARDPTPRVYGAVAVLGALGCWSKETFLVAALALLVCEALGPRGHRASLLAGAGGVATGWLARSWVVADVGGSSSGGLLQDSQLWGWLPRGVALAAKTLFVPTGQTMRALSFELQQPVGLGDVLGVAVMLGCAAAVVKWRRWDSGVLLGGALLTFLPSLYVAHTFWLGLDRYLYLPAVLAGLASAPALSRLPSLPQKAVLAVAAAAGMAFALGLATAAPSYASQDAWVKAMIDERPSDPTGYLLACDLGLTRGDPQGATGALAAAPKRPWPTGLARERARLERRLGRMPAAAQTLEESYAQAPDDPFVMLDTMGLRGAQGRFDEARQLGKALRSRAAFCPAARATLQTWAQTEHLPESERLLFAKLAAPACP